MTRADAIGIDQPARDQTQVEQTLEPEGFLVRGNLEHAVRGRVDDRLAGAHVLFAEPSR